MELPLRHQHILVTREKTQAIPFAEKITALGGKAHIVDLLKVDCLVTREDSSMHQDMNDYEWIFFTSANGVHCFFRQFQRVHHHKFAVVGPKTADALHEYGYLSDFIPSTYHAKTMAAEFLKKYPESGTCLFVRGKRASPVLIDAFTEAGQQFQCIEVYNTVTNVANKRRLQALLTNQIIDVITFTSPSTVDAYVELVQQAYVHGDTTVVCIGTTTEKRALEYGFNNILVPNEFTMEGMLHVLCNYIRRKGT